MNTGQSTNLSLEQKRALARELLRRQGKGETTTPTYRKYSYDAFLASMSPDPVEALRFSEFVREVEQDNKYAFEAVRLGAQSTETQVRRTNGERFSLLNFSNYNYLNYGQHPLVIQAAKDALDRYGLGAASSPIISGTFRVHEELEQRLVDFIGKESIGASLFSSGYGVNLGAISAFMKPGNTSHVFLDNNVHMSLVEGAQLSRARITFFEHNDIDDLERKLKAVAGPNHRILICAEGIYSAEGDKAPIADIVRVAKKYRAYTLIDEAHSFLVAGPTGRGVCEEQGVLDQVDLLTVTFSKGFSGVGGALIASQEMARYVNWYAKCRIFSCALDPAVTGGILKVLELASGDDGSARRKRLSENAALMRELLKGRVDILNTDSWIIPVVYGSDKLTIDLNDYLQRRGLDVGLMTFPAVPKNEARIRIFVTCGHSREQIETAASLLIEAAHKFGFQKRQ